MEETIHKSMNDELPSNAEMALLTSCMPWWLILVWGILAVFLGIMLVVTPISTALTLVLFMGAYWFVGGIFTLASLVWDRSHMGWKIFMGVISILGGSVIMAYPLFSSILVVEMLVFIIGFWAIIIGGVKLYDSYRSKDAGTGVLGILSILFGFILLVYPFAAAFSLSIVAGFFALIGGIATIVFSYQLKTRQPST